MRKQPYFHIHRESVMWQVIWRDPETGDREIRSQHATRAEARAAIRQYKAEAK